MVVGKWGESPEVLTAFQVPAAAEAFEVIKLRPSGKRLRTSTGKETADNSELGAIGRPGRTLQRLGVEQYGVAEERFEILAKLQSPLRRRH